MTDTKREVAETVARNLCERKQNSCKLHKQTVAHSDCNGIQRSHV